METSPNFGQSYKNDKKNWEKVTKEDIDELISEIMERFGSSNGQESNYSYDHKKILKIFFRWLKFIF